MKLKLLKAILSVIKDEKEKELIKLSFNKKSKDCNFEFYIPLLPEKTQNFLDTLSQMPYKVLLKKGSDYDLVYANAFLDPTVPLKEHIYKVINMLQMNCMEGDSGMAHVPAIGSDPECMVNIGHSEEIWSV
jgi:hypothetical protein